MTHVRIEDDGFIGDTPDGPLVGRDGAVGWLCLPPLRLGVVRSLPAGDRAERREERRRELCEGPVSSDGRHLREHT